MKITLLLTQHHRSLSVAALLDFFQSVNAILVQEGKDEYFKISIASNHHQHRLDGVMPVLLNEITTTDLILVPAFMRGNLQLHLESNREVIPWLQYHYSNKAEIASFCTGAYLLAMSGLLNGRKATTHMDAASALHKHFPEVILQQENVITDDKGIYTSGGATSTFHLMLYLLEKFCGKDMAIKISKYFAIDLDRKSQAHFGSFNLQKNIAISSLYRHRSTWNNLTTK